MYVLITIVHNDCGAMELWSYGAMELWSYGAMELWSCGDVELWSCGDVEMSSCVITIILSVFIRSIKCNLTLLLLHRVDYVILFFVTITL